mgnify:CR=1 FL=1
MRNRELGELNPPGPCTVALDETVYEAARRMVDHGVWSCRAPQLPARAGVPRMLTPHSPSRWLKPEVVLCVLWESIGSGRTPPRAGG